MKHIVTLVLLMYLSPTLRAQGADADVAKYMAMIASGQTETVKADIPALLSKYPNDPGVLYLQGLTTTEGAEAVRIYQSIVDNFPSSEWADDALYRVYQFYYSLGLYRTAELKMAQLKKNYPASRYLTGGSDAETKQLTEERPSVPVAAEPGPSGVERFTLQVGAYITAANAEKQKAVFDTLGYPVEVINRVKDGRSLFLVLVGTYGSAIEAKEKGAEIKKLHNVDSIVTTK